MTTIRDLALQAKVNAAAVVDRHVNPNQKQASIALYHVLAETLSICERCRLNPSDEQDIRDMIRADVPFGAKGRWVEKSSDIYQTVCRLIFTATDRTNAARYAAALREASKLQISSNRLADHMQYNGGVNALYFRRPLDRRMVKTKSLRLSSQVTIDRTVPFTIRLRWRDDNSFDVMEILHGPS